MAAIAQTNTASLLTSAANVPLRSIVSAALACVGTPADILTITGVHRLSATPNEVRAQLKSVVTQPSVLFGLTEPQITQNASQFTAVFSSGAAQTCMWDFTCEVTPASAT